MNRFDTRWRASQLLVDGVMVHNSPERRQVARAEFDSSVRLDVTRIGA